MKKIPPLLLGFAALLWLLASQVAYSVVHRPFSPEQLLKWLTMGWQLLACTAIVILAGGIGQRLTPLGQASLPPLTKATLQSGLGLAVLSLLVLALGQVSLTTVTVGGLLLLCGVLVWKNCLAWLKQWGGLATIQPQSKFATALLAGNALIVLFALGTALAPPIHFDALSYHLSIPMTYLANQQIGYLPENIFWGMPELVEMLYAAAMALAGLEAGAVLGVMMGLLALLGIIDYTTNIFDPDTGWVAGTALLAGETLASALSWGYVDWATLFFGFGTFVFLSRWVEEKQPPSLWLAGLFAGLALSTKYTAGITLLVGSGMLLLHKSSLREKFASLVQFGGLATLAFSPWAVKNFLATGNPVYPLLFPAGAMDIHRITKYHFSSPDVNWLRLLTLPWEITVLGLEGGAGYGASIGALLLGLSPLVFLNAGGFQEGQKRKSNFFLLATVLGLLIFATASQFAGLLGQTRLFYSFFSAWVLLAAAGYFAAAGLQTAAIRFKFILQALILFAFSLTVLHSVVGFVRKDLPAYLLSGNYTKEAYLEHNLTTLYQAMTAIQQLPPSAKVLSLWEPRSLYCLPRCDGDEIIDRWYQDWRSLGEIDPIEARWKAEGFTHVLYYRLGSDFIRETEKRKYNPDDWAGLDAMLQRLGVPLLRFGPEYELYELK